MVPISPRSHPHLPPHMCHPKPQLQPHHIVMPVNPPSALRPQPCLTALASARGMPQQMLMEKGGSSSGMRWRPAATSPGQDSPDAANVPPLECGPDSGLAASSACACGCVALQLLCNSALGKKCPMPQPCHPAALRLLLEACIECTHAPLVRASLLIYGYFRAPGSQPPHLLPCHDSTLHE